MRHEHREVPGALPDDEPRRRQVGVQPLPRARGRPVRSRSPYQRCTGARTSASSTSQPAVNASESRETPRFEGHAGAATRRPRLEDLGRDEAADPDGRRSAPSRPRRSHGRGRRLMERQRPLRVTGEGRSDGRVVPVSTGSARRATRSRPRPRPHATRSGVPRPRSRRPYGPPPETPSTANVSRASSVGDRGGVPAHGRQRRRGVGRPAVARPRKGDEPDARPRGRHRRRARPGDDRPGCRGRRGAAGPARHRPATRRPGDRQAAAPATARRW